jgi:hypothetical protein
MPGRIELIGVYQLSVTEELCAAQAELLYGENPSSHKLAQARHQIEAAVLVEVLVSNADADFDVADFMQEDPQLPEVGRQVAWAEAFRSADGQQ